MYRLGSGLFVLLVMASIGSALDSKHFHVHLKPSTIKVCEGALVQMNCTWNPPENVEYSNTPDKVKWYFNNYTNESKCDSQKIFEGTSFFNNKTYTWSVLSKPSIRTNESGWYFCHITRDIPVLEKNCSNGILILVEANPTKDPPGPNSTSDLNQTSTPEQTIPNVPTKCPSTAPPESPNGSLIGQWWLWVALAVGCVILIMSVVAVCMLSCRTKEIIYENTLPKKPGCWRRDRTQTDGCNLPMSKKVETIKPLRKYDTIPQNKGPR